VPVLIKEGPQQENPWGIRFMTMLHMANDSRMFRTHEQMVSSGWQLEGNVFVRDGESYVPLYEAKMLYQLNHRHGDYSLLEPGERGHVLPATPPPLS
jgi:hypothetical protein